MAEITRGFDNPFQPLEIHQIVPYVLKDDVLEAIPECDNKCSVRFVIDSTKNIRTLKSGPKNSRCFYFDDCGAYSKVNTKFVLYEAIENDDSINFVWKSNLTPGPAKIMCREGAEVEPNDLLTKVTYHWKIRNDEKVFTKRHSIHI